MGGRNRGYDVPFLMESMGDCWKWVDGKRIIRSVCHSFILGISACDCYKQTMPSQ